MADSQQLHLEQKTVMRLTQQQLRFVKLLEYNAPELDEAVERELEDNPALTPSDTSVEESEYIDTDTTPAQRWWQQRCSDENFVFSPADTNESLYENLLEQLNERHLTARVESAARYIIGSLDPNGYLERSVTQLVNDMTFNEGLDITEEETEEALRTVRSLDPPGIGASDLRQCLILQLEAMTPSEKRDDALAILRDAFEAFTMKHKHRIISQLKLSAERVDDALALILTLNPKPGAGIGHNDSDVTNIVIPDFILTKEDDKITVTLNNRIPELQIEVSFEQAMAELSTRPRGKARKGSEFIVSRYNDARDFIKLISQRQQTMMKVMTAIVAIQREYFLTEDVYTLKPMMLKNISDMTGLDFSVISRATANKFVATPWGIFPLRFFFSDTVGDNNSGTGSEALTNRKIEAEIEALVKAEDKRHPLSDQKIMEEMARRGFDVSRRTVAKYRDRCGIPVARLRKEL